MESLRRAKEGDEIVEGDGERLGSGSAKFAGGESEAAEAAGINKAQLAAGGEMQHAVRVRGLRDFRMSDEQTAGHAEMHDPLERGERLCGGVVAGGRVQIEDDVLADAANAANAAAGEGGGHFVGWCFEGLRIAGEPGGENGVAAKAAVHARSDGFDFRKFGHGARLG